MTEPADQEPFRATSGRVSGVLALVLCLAVPVLWVVDRDVDPPGWLIWLSLVGAVLAWAAMLKPALWIAGDHLVMRNMLETTRIPLAAIEQVAARQVFAVLAGEKRYVSPAVGKSWRQALRSNKRRDAGGGAQTYAEVVEDRVWQAADDARTRLGIANTSDEQLELARTIRRDPAWPEIGALGVTLLGFVATLVL